MGLPQRTTTKSYASGVLVNCLEKKRNLQFPEIKENPCAQGHEFCVTVLQKFPLERFISNYGNSP